MRAHHGGAEPIERIVHVRAARCREMSEPGRRAPLGARIPAHARRIRVEPHGVEVGAVLVRVRAVEGRRLDPQAAREDTHRHDPKAGMCDVLGMMPERRDGIERGRGTMQIGHRAEGGFPYQSGVERSGDPGAHRVLVHDGGLRHDVVGMLPVRDDASPVGLGDLEQLRISAAAPGRRALKGRHRHGPAASPRRRVGGRRHVRAHGGHQGRRIALRRSGSLYAALVGEPALGPVTYLHRPSAAFDPVTPLGHHSQDVTHTSFGVVTVGVFTRSLRVEASSFNGAHPDEDRTNFDPVRLDSYATRVSWNPGAEWSAAVWFGHLAASGGAHVHDALDRFGASVVRTHGSWSTALVYGADLAAGAGHPLNTLLLETTFELNEVNAVYGRAEYVRRTAADLALIGSVGRELGIGAVSVGYERRVWRRAPVAAGLGARGTLNLVPEELRLFYGSCTPAGLVAYLQLRPNARM